MKRNDAERLLISIGIAAGLFGAAGLTLSFIDIPAGEMPPYQGPVFITIEEEPPVFQEPPEEPEPVSLEPETVPDRPETAAESETIPRREPEEPPPAETEDTRPTETQRSSSSGTEAAAETAAEGAAPEEAEEPAAAGVDTGAAETEPLPEGDFETDVSPREGPETVEETAPAEPEERSVVGDLSELDRAIAESGGDEGAGDDDEQTAEEEVTRLGTPESPIDFETLAGTREPISLPQPEIDPALVQSGAPFFTVVISFTLLPSGHITDLNITPDSGNTKVDSIIQTAIRKWRFEPVSEDAGPIQVRVRYNIRVR
jgi:TonB family protein